MNFTSKYLLIFIFTCLLNSGYAQEIGIGQWRDHLPYNKCLSVAEAGNKIYTSTPFALFSYDKTDLSLQRLSKVNGLSDIGISWISYNTTCSTLVIAYTNTNIDLLKNGQIINISDIKRKEILGNKTINKITCIGKYAYLSCGFGIVVLDVEKEEIYDTYYIGPNGSQIDVLDLTLDTNDSTLWAATETGMYKASFNNPFISNYTSWSKDTIITGYNDRCNLVAYFNNKIYVNKSDGTWGHDSLYVRNNNIWQLFSGNSFNPRYSLKTIYDKLIITSSDYVDILNFADTVEYHMWGYAGEGYPQTSDATLDSENNLWIADKNYGLVKNWDKQNFSKLSLNGPLTADVFSMAASGNNVYSVAGGKTTTWAPMWNHGGVASFINNQWSTYSLPDSISDCVGIAVDPSNAQKIYVATWSKGIIEYTNGEVTNVYTDKNSTLSRNILWNDMTMISGLCFDQDNNLWVSNQQSNKAISCRKPDGSWTSYDLGSVVNGQNLGPMIIDNNNQKWILLRGTGIAVCNAENTTAKKLTSSQGSGNLPGNFTLSIAQDLDGAIWVGTDEGVVVIYSPENVFNGGNFDAQKILIDFGGYVQYLLETETVTSIAIDGANRKWFGTDKSGAYLMSADGTKQLLHFTTDNSPLFSNSITSIAIDNDGEVFFGTSKGIISYKSDAAPEPSPTSDNKVYAYPNPVKSGYDGPIAIKGLKENSDIKITDISGNLIFATKSLGSQAIWDGKNFSGKKAKTGVYLVFASDSNGSSTLVTKILFIN